jgi:hypothetical protein
MIHSKTGKKKEFGGKKAYTEEELQAAVSDIRSGKIGTRRAAVLYGIPRSTLRNKIFKMDTSDLGLSAEHKLSMSDLLQGMPNGDYMGFYGAKKTNTTVPVKKTGKENWPRSAESIICWTWTESLACPHCTLTLESMMIWTKGLGYLALPMPTSSNYPSCLS